MLVSNTGLQSLNLDNNDIREAGLVALLKVLKEIKLTREQIQAS